MPLNKRAPNKGERVCMGMGTDPKIRGLGMHFPCAKLYERAIGARCRSRGMRGPRLILAEPFSAHSFDHSFSNFSNLHNFSMELCSFGSFFFPHSGAIYSGRCSSFLAAAAAAYTFC